MIFHDKDILNNVIFAFKMSLLSEIRLMAVVLNMHKRHVHVMVMKGVMSVLCTPLQVIHNDVSIKLHVKSCYNTHITNKFIIIQSANLESVSGKKFSLNAQCMQSVGA